MGIVETRSHLPAILKTLAPGKRVIITQRSHARAVLVSPEELETLEVQADKGLLEDIRAAKEDIRRGRALKARDYFARRNA